MLRRLFESMWSPLGRFSSHGSACFLSYRRPAKMSELYHLGAIFGSDGQTDNVAGDGQQSKKLKRDFSLRGRSFARRERKKKTGHSARNDRGQGCVAARTEE